MNMKKTIMVAIASVSFGAFAGTANVFSSCEATTCNSVYRLKLAGKTVSAKNADTSNSCCSVTCWVKPASYRVAGYIYNLDGDCDCQDAIGGSCHFWDANKKQVFAESNIFEPYVFEVLRNSGAMDKVQIAFRLGDVQFAGFGTYSPTTKMLKNASGFFAGTLPAAVCSNEATCGCEEPTIEAAYVFAPCTLKETESANSIVYGRWSLTRRDDKAAEIKRTGSTDCLYPTAYKAAE